MNVASAAWVTPEDSFASLQTRYGLAVQGSGEVSHDLALGPERLRVSFAGSAIADALMGPLQRLVVAAGDEPSAEIHVWDTASSETPPPEFPARVDLDPTEATRYRSIYLQDFDRLKSLAMFDTWERVGHFWFDDFARIRSYERAEPLRTAIHWALSGAERFLVHASAVGDERGAIVLTGPGGAGKTTTTLAALDSELRIVGDNYVLVSLTDADPMVYGLFGTVKLWPPTLEQLPWLTPMVINPAVPADEKLVVDLAGHRPSALVAALPVRAVVVPRVTDSGPAQIQPCTRGRALFAMAPTTTLQLPRTERAFSGMAELVRRVPTFELTLGPDLMDGPRVLSELLGELSS